jgi:hypothetical protein
MVKWIWLTSTSPITMRRVSLRMWGPVTVTTRNPSGAFSRYERAGNG